jgi:hypothetical protein
LSQLTIKTRELTLRKFDIDYVDPVYGDLGWAQRPFIAEVERQYNSGKPVRTIVLKARQLGISTATEGILFWWGFIHHGTNGLVLAHETTPSLELFEMTKLYWDTFPYNSLYELKYNTKQNMHWLETRSRLRVASAKNLASGRGSTVHALHVSEAAFYPDPKTLWTGLSQTIPNRHGTIVVMESTANGVGNFFYEFWQEAEEGGNDFVPLFFPWYKHPEYRMFTTLNIRSELDSYEKELLARGASYENLAWRRWAIPNLATGDIDLFMQEYPSTPEEAFITSGRPIFSHGHLRNVFREERGVRGMFIDEENGRVRFVPDRSGNWTLFRRPRIGDTRQDRYFIAGDPSESIAGDPACIQVLDRKYCEQVAVWHGRSDPYVFAKEMLRAGKYFNWAMLCPEVMGGGQAAIATILNSGYPSVWQYKRADRIQLNQVTTFGWATNMTSKDWCIGHLQRLIVDHSIVLHDRVTYNQLRNYVQRENGEWGNANSDTHDDSVMAIAIATTASWAEGPYMADPDTGNTIIDLYNQEKVG